MQLADLGAISAAVLLSLFVTLTIRLNRRATPPREALAGLSLGLGAVWLYVAGLGWGLVSALMSEEYRTGGWLILFGGALLPGLLARDRSPRVLVGRANALTGTVLAYIVIWLWTNGYRLAIPWQADGARSITQDLDLVFVGGVVAYLIANLLASSGSPATVVKPITAPRPDV
jgi:hypothetical protein